MVWQIVRSKNKEEPKGLICICLVTMMSDQSYIWSDIMEYQWQKYNCLLYPIDASVNTNNRILTNYLTNTRSVVMILYHPRWPKKRKSKSLVVIPRHHLYNLLVPRVGADHSQPFLPTYLWRCLIILSLIVGLQKNGSSLDWVSKTSAHESAYNMFLYWVQNNGH